MSKVNRYFYSSATEPDEPFIEKYRQKYKHDDKLPCLECTDEQIAKCASIPLKPRMEKLGCAKFKVYERIMDRTTKKDSKKRK